MAGSRFRSGYFRWAQNHVPIVGQQEPLTLALSLRERELTGVFGRRYADVGYRGEFRLGMAWII
jgi:hypothetical protein